LKIYGATVRGVDIDRQTRCAHYHGERDIVAIKFKCCGSWFACLHCHSELAGHAAEVWAKEEAGERAVICGNCGTQLTIREYLNSASACRHCKHQFNPGCATHHHLYFEM
jgi:uncharacterized CHY-type Zn-finger protein